VSAPPWMLLRLAVETASHHAVADEDRLGLLDARTPERYRKHLVRIYGFEAPVEAALSRIATLHGPLRGLVRERTRMAFLRLDLRGLGKTTAQLSAMPVAAVEITDVAHALGWLFVLERSTLLAGIIQRDLQRAMPDTMVRSCNYLNASAYKPGVRLRALGEAIGNFAQRCAPSAIVAGAIDAFRMQRQWTLLATPSVVGDLSYDQPVRRVRWTKYPSSVTE